MHEDEKRKVVVRNRDQRRNEAKVKLRAHKISQMQADLASLIEETENLLEAGELRAKDCDLKLRLSDEESIKSIHNANKIKAEREVAEKHLKLAEEQNGLLLCENLNQEADIHIIDRFINVMYSVAPKEVKYKLLANQQHHYVATNLYEWKPWHLQSNRTILPKQGILKLEQIFYRGSCIEFSAWDERKATTALEKYLDKKIFRVLHKK